MIALSDNLRTAPGAANVILSPIVVKGVVLAEPLEPPCASNVITVTSSPAESASKNVLPILFGTLTGTNVVNVPELPIVLLELAATNKVLFVKSVSKVMSSTMANAFYLPALLANFGTQHTNNVVGVNKLMDVS